MCLMEQSTVGCFLNYDLFQFSAAHVLEKFRRQIYMKKLFVELGLCCWL